MQLWPYCSFEVETAHSTEECIALLNSEIEPNKWSGSHKIFQGVVSAAGFKMTRIIHYRNSFLPTIYGSFRSSFPGTVVVIKMKMSPLITAFMCFWFGFVGFALIVSIIGSKPGMALVPLCMLLFGWALENGGFWFEVKRVKLVLKNLLSANVL